ncbi:hypothetical protein CLU79DRAFT_769290 [Phycomyces nitens]|nr:hypothetical protein CLU79DRAFT_769290 [Phycomyces nitens]
MSNYDWIEIPVSQSADSLYANPSTGECILQRPTSGTIKPTNPQGDCWELWDDQRQTTYFFHPQTGVLDWHHPVDVSVVSMVQVQKSAVFRDHLSLPVILTPDNTPCRSGASSPETKRNSRSLDLAPLQTRPRSHVRSTSDGGKDPVASSDLSHSRISELALSEAPSGFPFNLGKLLNPPTRKQSLHSTETQTSSLGDRSRRLSHFSAFNFRSQKTTSQGSGAMGNSLKSLVSRSGVSPATSRYSIAISAPVNSPDAAELMNPVKQSPIPGPLASPTLPTGLRQDINRFAIDGFAQKYFSTHKRGLFRRRVPMTEMLQWTKDSLRQPLIMLNKDLYKDALRCFKLIQTIMGDRPRPRNTTEIEDYQTILVCGITKGQMRDEIYVQVCKQIRDNPSGESIKRGWEILCVISVTFPPSKNLEGYLGHFVEQHHHTKENQADIISRHVSTKLKRICVRGAKGKVLTPPEIERAKEAPFKPSVFGESLEFIMGLQRNKDSSLQLPQIVPFLAEAVREMNGQKSEGIFRVSGDADAVTDLRIRIENGNYDTSSITDPNVPASLIKLWLRELSSPLILPEFYDGCIRCAEDPAKALAIINALPNVNRRIVLYMISFLQEFTDPAITEHTLMNISNLAMVFAPNFLRCPSESLTTVFENSKYEQSFLKTLLTEITVNRNVCLYDEDSSLAVGELMK